MTGGSAVWKAEANRVYSTRYSVLSNSGAGCNTAIIAGFAPENLDIVKDCTIKIFGYNTGIMEDFSPFQLITLCFVFIGFHLLAVPAFLWAMRHRQFSGHEQKEWNLDSGVSPETPIAPAVTAPMPARARVMLSILGAMGVAMLASIFLVLFTALHATAHPAVGKCPF